MKKIVLYFSYISFIFLFVSCQEKKKMEYYEDAGEVFHTNYHIKYEYSGSLTSEILAELAKFDDSLNPFKSSSIISKVNSNQDVVLDSFFIMVFNRAAEIAQATGGAFDITCSPLVNAWGFGFKNMPSVTAQQIDSMKQFVGYKKISLNSGKVLKTDPRVQINTSAIAKGYSSDVVANLFDALGISNYMVEIGGEIVAKGVNEHGECWRIGIDKPIDDKEAKNRELQYILQICDKSVATSGNYRNFYIKDGKKYAHTIDPKTGYPAEGRVLGATVIADDCMTADAFATAFMVMKMDEISNVAAQQGLDYLLIYSTEEGGVDVNFSSGFEDRYVIK